MALHQYIGARYVPKFYENSLGTSAWEAGVIYEPLTIVTYNGNSYTSKKLVPANIGNPSVNTSYWVATGVFNQQLGTLENRVTELEQTAIRNIKHRRFVIIGDSYLEGYTPDGHVTGWGTLFAQYLGLNASQYELQYRGGAGFVSNSQGKSFVDLIGDSAISDPDTVTDVIVAGGANDYNQGAPAIDSAIGVFAGIARLKYPNAKIWCGFCGWMRDGAKIYTFATAVRNYINSCAKYGIVYLSNIEYCMHRYFSNFASDGLHANQYGQELIAKNVVDNILGGSGDFYAPYLTMEVTIPSGDTTTVKPAMTMKPGFVTVMSGNITAYTFGTGHDIASYSCDGNTAIDLGEISGSSYVYGSAYNVLAVDVNCDVQANGTYYNVPGQFLIVNGHLNLRLKKIEAGTWLTLTNLHYITIGRFCVTFDALMC